jgi:hypothetical protein
MVPTAPGELFDGSTPPVPDAAAELFGGGSPATPDAPASILGSTVPALRITGALTVEGESVTFPDLQPAGSHNGRQAWTDDGAEVSEMGAGQSCTWLAPYWYLAWETGIAASWRSPADLDSPIGASPWTPNTDATGQPTVAVVGPDAPGSII